MQWPCLEPDRGSVRRMQEANPASRATANRPAAFGVTSRNAFVETIMERLLATRSGSTADEFEDGQGPTRPLLQYGKSCSSTMACAGWVTSARSPGRFTQITAGPASALIRRGCTAVPDGPPSLIDAMAAGGSPAGHGHPVMAAAIAEQAHRLEQVIFADHATSWPNNSLNLVAGSGLERLFFSDNGSKRWNIAAEDRLCGGPGHTTTPDRGFDGAYHGDTSGRWPWENATCSARLRRQTVPRGNSALAPHLVGR